MLAKARYEDNLEFTIDVPENLGDITVPRLTLQPLVENALTHGFDGRNVLRKLSISGHIEGGLLVLEIRDNGTGFSGEMLQSLRSLIRDIEAGTVSIESTGGHIGLINTCLRLHYYSKGAMRMSIRNDSGAVITLTMPCSAQQSTRSGMSKEESMPSGSAERCTLLRPYHALRHCAGILYTSAQHGGHDNPQHPSGRSGT